MRVRWITVTLGAVLGCALLAMDISEAFAQKGRGQFGRGPGLGLRTPGWGGNNVGVFIGTAQPFSPTYPYRYSSLPYYSQPYPHSIYYQGLTYSYPTQTPAYQNYYYSPPPAQPPKSPPPLPREQPAPPPPTEPAPPAEPQPGPFHPPGIPSTELETAIPTVNVSIHDNYFLPKQIEIRTGTTVRWMNMGQQQHTVAQPGTDWRSQDLGHGDAFQYTFTKPGTYVYHCTHHPEMTGTIIVK